MLPDRASPGWFAMQDELGGLHGRHDAVSREHVAHGGGRAPPDRDQKARAAHARHFQNKWRVEMRLEKKKGPKVFIP